MTDLLRDWVTGRDSKTFVHRSKDKSGSWDSGYKGAGSGFILNKKTATIDVGREGYRLCKQRLNNLCPGKGLYLSFDPQNSYTDGRKVVVSTDVLDIKSYLPQYKIDVLLGITTHEAAHVLYTDFNRKYYKNKFQKTILNIIEDERIEALIGANYPGYAPYLEKLKTYYFDFSYIDKSFEGDGAQAFDLFFKLIRYPKHVDVELVEKHEAFLSQVKDILTPFPVEFIDAFHASVKIDELFKSEFDFEVADDSKSGSTSSGKADKFAEQFDDLDSTSQFPDKTKLSDLLSGEDAEVNFEIIERGASLSLESQTYFVTGKNRKDIYEQVRRQVMPAARSLSNSLNVICKDKTVTQYGMKSGSFDGNKLIDAYMGIENIYKQSSNIKSPKLNLVLMIDESGSMCGGDKIEKAQQAAVLFNEAVKMMPAANLYIYGFTSSYFGEDSNTITIYQEPGAKNLDYALGSVDGKASNRDGICIREVCKRVRSLTKQKALLVVISDGQPAGRNYCGEEAIRDTAMAVVQAEKLNFVPIQIGIDVDTVTQAMMFNNFVNYNSANQMAEDIGRKIKSLLPKLI